MAANIIIDICTEDLTNVINKTITIQLSVVPLGMEYRNYIKNEILLAISDDEDIKE